MKKAIWGSVLVIIGIISIVIILTLTGRNTRETEADNALAEAIDTSLSNVFKNHSYASDESDKFVADFLEALLIQTGSKSEISVSILDADLDTGILSVEIKETYKHPNGNTGTVSDVRTVVLDQKSEKEIKTYEVVFCTADDEIYKKYTLRENDTCPMPEEPKKEGKTFRCWRFVTGGSGTAEQAAVTAEEGGETKMVLASGGNPYRAAEDTKLIAVFE